MKRERERERKRERGEISSPHTNTYTNPIYTYTRTYTVNTERLNRTFRFRGFDCTMGVSIDVRTRTLAEPISDRATGTKVKGIFPLSLSLYSFVLSVCLPLSLSLSLAANFTRARTGVTHEAGVGNSLRAIHFVDKTSRRTWRAEVERERTDIHSVRL